MNTELGRILIVDDNTDVLLAARLLLKKYAAAVHTESNPENIPAILANGTFDIVLLDMNFTADASSGKEGYYWLRRIREINPEIVVVMITAYGDIETAVKSIKEGATDFVVKPWQNEKLLATLSAAMKLRCSMTEVGSLRSRQRQLSEDLDHPFTDFIGKSPAMQGVYATITKVAVTDANVLILGENGTGKELVARELHRMSSRANEVFITSDMGAITETLFESELFGHVRGAFTDAREDRAGRFEIASGGTLFLDEIGNLPHALQAKLLHVLESREVTRVGSNRPIPIDVRLITATNMPVHDMVAERTFRQDLLYRINTVEIKLPPLRERGEDIKLLAEHFLARYARKYNKDVTGISSPALHHLMGCRWPGNVRELQHAVERAVIMSEGGALKPADFPQNGAQQMSHELAMDSLSIDETEKLLIRKAIDKHRGNVSKAAHELGISRASLYRRMEKYDL